MNWKVIPDADIIGAWLGRPAPPPTPLALLLRRVGQ